MKILVAYDGGDAAKRALELAARFGSQLRASVDVISVVPLHPGRAPMDPWDDPAVHEEQLREADAYLRSSGIEPVLIRRVGDPSHVIEDVAGLGGYDMVVIGSRNLGAIGRLLQGSVSEHVATHSPTTVVVAR